MHGTIGFSESDNAEAQDMRFENSEDGDTDLSATSSRKLWLLATCALVLVGSGTFAAFDNGLLTNSETAAPEAKLAAIAGDLAPALTSKIAPQIAREPIVATKAEPEMAAEKLATITPSISLNQPADPVSAPALAEIDEAAAMPERAEPIAIVQPPIAAIETAQAAPTPAPAPQAILRVALPEATLASTASSPAPGNRENAPATMATTWAANQQNAASNPRADPMSKTDAPIRISLADVPVDRPPLPELMAAPTIIAIGPQGSALAQPAIAKAAPSAPTPPLRPQKTAPELLATRETAGRVNPAPSRRQHARLKR